MVSILIIDMELGFMWAIAKQLQARGIATIPARSVDEAKRVLASVQPKEISVVILNCRCRGVCSFASQLRKKYYPLRVIGIVSDGAQCRGCEQLLIATLEDPEDREPQRLAHCVELISILANHALPIQ